MSGDEEDGIDVEALSHACTEARYTIDQQIAKIHQEDKKAIRISRLNLIILSIFASGLSLSLNYNQVDTNQFLNVHVPIGAVALLFSSVLASMAYTSSSFEMGMSPTPIQEAKSGELDHEGFINRLSSEYTTWVRKNRKVHRFNSYAITWALIFGTGGLLFFIGGVIVGIQKAKASSFSVGLLIIAFFAILIIGFCLYNSDYIFRTLMEIQDGND